MKILSDLDKFVLDLIFAFLELLWEPKVYRHGKVKIHKISLPEIQSFVKSAGKSSQKLPLISSYLVWITFVQISL